MQSETSALLKLLETIAPYFIAAIPGLWVLVETKLDKRKKTAAAKVDESTAADKLSMSALSLVKHHEEDTKRFREMAEHYETIAEHLKEGFDVCKDKLQDLSDEMECMRDIDIRRTAENSELMKKNTELIERNIELTKKVELLEKTVNELVQQLKEIGIEPKYGKRLEDTSKGEN